MNQNFNSFGFDHIQPPQQFDNHQPQEIPEVTPFVESKEWIETNNELYTMMEDFTERMNQELRKQEVLLAAQREQELLAQKQEEQEVKNIAEPAAKRQTRITSCLQNFKVIHKENIIPLNKTPQISPSIALVPVSSIMEPEDSLIMRNEELSTIPEKESDEFIKSSVEDLIPIPRESEDTSGSDRFLKIMKTRACFQSSNHPVFDLLLIMESSILIMYKGLKTKQKRFQGVVTMVTVHLEVVSTRSVKAVTSTVAGSGSSPSLGPLLKG
ncbi:hypothetical protein Tco_0248200 [Tanacetum coccineum]